MKIVELRQKSKEELESLVHEKRAKVEELRWQSSQKKVKNVRELNQEKKDIAQILTVLHSTK